MAKSRPAMDVGQMHLDERYGDPRERIAQRHARMRGTGRVDDDENDSLGLRLVDPVDQLSLEIALEAEDFSTRGSSSRAEAAVDGLQGLVPLGPLLPGTQELQVTPADTPYPPFCPSPPFRPLRPEIAWRHLAVRVAQSSWLPPEIGEDG